MYLPSDIRLSGGGREVEGWNKPAECKSDSHSSCLDCNLLFTYRVLSCSMCWCCHVPCSNKQSTGVKVEIDDCSIMNIGGEERYKKLLWGPLKQSNSLHIHLKATLATPPLTGGFHCALILLILSLNYIHAKLTLRYHFKKSYRMRTLTPAQRHI